MQDLDLSEIEFNLLSRNKAKYFSDDAWISLKTNHESCYNHEGYILPTYTLSAGEYWLFYYPGKLSEVKQLCDDQKIWGYWLNKRNENLYELVLGKKKVSVNGISIICLNDTQKNILGRVPLFIRRKLPLKDKSLTSISGIFHRSILTCLEKHGFGKAELETGT